MRQKEGFGRGENTKTVFNAKEDLRKSAQKAAGLGVKGPSREKRAPGKGKEQNQGHVKRKKSKIG